MKPSPGVLAFVFSIMVGAVSLSANHHKSQAANWPQFRGPNASGILESATPPLKIGPDSNVLWVIDVPWSPSSPSIWGDKIFLTSFDGGRLETRAYDRENGKLLWKKGVKPAKLEEYHQFDNSPAAPTAATDGKHVVSYFGSFGLICYDFQGKELWRYEMPTAWTHGRYGSSTSPIIANGNVYIIRDDRVSARLIALDAATGKLRWESPRPEARGGYGSPIVWGDQIIVPGAIQLKAYDLESGQQRWMVDGLSPVACTTPVLGNGRVYQAAWSPGGFDSPRTEWSEFAAKHDKNGDNKVGLVDLGERSWNFMRGMDKNVNDVIDSDDWDLMQSLSKRNKNLLVAIEAGGKGDITDSHVSWSYRKGLPYVPSPLFYKDRIYMIKDGGILSSLNADTGELYFEEKIEGAGKYYSSPVAANGHLYVASLDGKLSVIKAGGNEPEVIHQADFGERIFATPALVDDKLYLRTETKLYAFGQ
jgi:outer membrane protein assembly factor BamB